MARPTFESGIPALEPILLTKRQCCLSVNLTLLAVNSISGVIMSIFGHPTETVQIIWLWRNQIIEEQCGVGGYHLAFLSTALSFCPDFSVSCLPFRQNYSESNFFFNFNVMILNLILSQNISLIFSCLFSFGHLGGKLKVQRM